MPVISAYAVAAAVTDQIPDYSTVQVWIGTIVLLAIVAVIVTAVSFTLQHGRHLFRHGRGSGHHWPLRRHP